MIKLIGFQKGVNLGGWLSQGSLDVKHLDEFIKEEDIKRIKQMGCDHLRLPVDFENIFDEIKNETKEIGFKYIDLCIKWCKNNNLNVVLDLHKAPGYVFDNLEYSKGFFDDPKLNEMFLNIWDVLSKRYAKYSDMMMFEMLNEVTDFSFSDSWNKLALKCIKVIRKNAPNVKILYGGVGYSSVKSVKLMAPPYDKNIVYNVHCYEPMAFSHQRAHWMSDMDFTVKYPIPDDEYRKIAEKSPYIKNSLIGEPEIAIKALKDNFFINLFKEAVDIANKYDVALYCGEYGVIDKADTKSTLRWFKDINNAFTYYGIGRAVWSYKEMDFGIIGDHYKDIYDELLKYL